MTAEQLRLGASAVLAAAVLLLLGIFGLAVGLVQQRAVLVVIALGLALAVAVLAQPLLRRWLLAPRRLQDQAGLLLHHPVPGGVQDTAPGALGGGVGGGVAGGGVASGVADPDPDADPALRSLARTITELARQRDQLRADIDAAVARASHGVAQERNRLAALMSELQQSVVVCNLDGRVLLYNQRARQQLQAPGDGPQAAGGVELVGLGRSIHTVLDQALLAHALAAVQQRLRRGEARPSAQFVTATRGGQLLRVQLAPVRAGDAPGADAPLTGYVLVLDNITRSHAQEAAQDRALQALTEGSRGSLANLQAAAEMLDDADLPPALRAQFLAVVRDEAQAMGRRLQDLAPPAASRWPLDDMLGSEFVQAAAAAMAQAVQPAGALQVGMQEVDAALWLQLDSFALLQALCGLARRLHDERDVRTLHLRLRPAPPPAGSAQGGQGGRAHLDLVWTGQAMSTEVVMGWETDPLPMSADSSRSSSPALTVREVVQRHGGEFWFERDRVRHQAFFRFLLPQAQPVAPPGPFDRHAARPEVVDYDLFAQFAFGTSGHALDAQPLASLAFTVFDTETTGLQPLAGDEILQLGAVRIVNGRLLQGERFDQLVDPRRDIPAAGIAIHGITPAMVAGQPHILQVLPAFHAFAADSVLVAHNAAFDLQFLQLKEKASGLRFDQPVLDTLLLSALVHPGQASHALDDVARRLGVPVAGRHAALGDALVTAAVLLKLLPLLAGMGLVTLGQVRAASQQTQRARHPR